jgi:hypothetical protein
VRADGSHPETGTTTDLAEDPQERAARRWDPGDEGAEQLLEAAEADPSPGLPPPGSERGRLHLKNRKLLERLGYVEIGRPAEEPGETPAEPDAAPQAP